MIRVLEHQVWFASYVALWGVPMRRLYNQQISLISPSQSQPLRLQCMAHNCLFQDSSRLSVVGIRFLQQLAMMTELFTVPSLMHSPDRVPRSDPGEQFPMTSWCRCVSDLYASNKSNLSCRIATGITAILLF